MNDFIIFYFRFRMGNQEVRNFFEMIFWKILAIIAVSVTEKRKDEDDMFVI